MSDSHNKSDILNKLATNLKSVNSNPQTVGMKIFLHRNSAFIGLGNIVLLFIQCQQGIKSLTIRLMP